jgi:hypothetical protein
LHFTFSNFDSPLYPALHSIDGDTAAAQTLDGKTRPNDSSRCGEYRSRILAQISPVCQFTFPFLERLYRRYGGDSATFLGISQDDARDTRSFAKEFGVTFPMLLDDEDGYIVSNAYGLTNVPTILLIGAEGTVKVSSMGFDRKDLETIAAELAQRRNIILAPLFRPDEVVPINKPG